MVVSVLEPASHDGIPDNLNPRLWKTSKRWWIALVIGSLIAPMQVFIQLPISNLTISFSDMFSTLYVCE